MTFSGGTTGRSALAMVAMVETGQMEKAVKQLDKLDQLCFFGCQEYTKLKNAIDSHQQASSS